MSAQVETSGIIRQERPYEPVRTKTCGELRLADVGSTVTIAGWVQLSRDKGHFCFVDLRDRYRIICAIFSNFSWRPQNRVILFSLNTRHLPSKLPNSPP